jgi:hypothetical protein
MRRLATSKVVAWFAGISAAYAVASRLVPMPTLIDALNGAFLAVALLVTMIYAPLFWRSIRKHEIDRVGLLAIGIGALWTAYVGARILSAYYRNFGNISNGVNDPWFGYFVLIALAAGVLHVVAPGYPAEGIKAEFGGRYRWYIIAALAVGIGAALAL